MSNQIRDIALIVDGSSEHGVLFDVAARIAAKHKAHVTGIHVVPPFPSGASIGSEVLLPEAIIEQYNENSLALDRKCRASFQAAMTRAGVLHSWIGEIGDPIDAPSRYARYSDFAMVLQPEPESGSRLPTVINHLLLHGGRPVLVVPYVGASTTPGRSIVVGWNGSAPSARAANDALGFLTDAEDVEVVYVDKSRGRQVDEDLGASVPVSEHFARHDIECAATTIPNRDLDPGTVLLNRAADRGADMIVAGAWGHTRAGEFLFGGTTRTLLKTMTVPVFFSH